MTERTDAYGALEAGREYRVDGSRRALRFVAHVRNPETGAEWLEFTDVLDGSYQARRIDETFNPVGFAPGRRDRGTADQRGRSPRGQVTTREEKA